MCKVELIENKGDLFLDILRFVTGFQLESYMRLKEDRYYTCYFLDGSEYRLNTVNGEFTKETTGVCAWIYKTAVGARAAVCNNFMRA